MEAAAKDSGLEWWENPKRFWFNAFTCDTNDEWACGWCFGTSKEEALASALERIRVEYPKVKGSRKISFQQDIKNPEYFTFDVILKGEEV
jgi:hypothetical protein